MNSKKVILSVANFFKKIYNFFLNLKIEAYYYVPECPECKSKKTGRYIRQQGAYDTEWIEIECLKKGELVIILPEPQIKNCFCGDCGYEWSQKINSKLVSINELKRQKEIRQTIPLLAEKMKDKHDRIAKLESKRSFVSKHLNKFIGHI